MTAPGDFTSGDILTAADMNALPGGLLSYTETGSDFSLSTSFTDVVSTTFTVPSARRLLLQGVVTLADLPSTTLQVSARLSNGSGGGGTQYQQSYSSMNTSLTQTALHCFRLWQFTAGTYTVYLSASTSTGTARVNNIAPQRAAFVAVYDVGLP